MKKTLLHITEVSSGGVLPVIANICNGLSDKYNIVVAYGVRFDTPKNLETYFNEKVKLIVVKNFIREIAVKKDLAAVRELRKIIKEVQPDVIHMHSSKAGALGRISSIFYKGKKYYTPHGYSFLQQDDNWGKGIVFYGIEKFLSHTSCITIACGNCEFEYAKKINKNAKMVKNGIDIKYIDNVLKNCDRDRHGYTVYTAGRIMRQKNPQQFNEIARKCPNINFIWIGGSEGDSKEVLTSDNIQVTGFVSRDRVIQIAQNCDCFISCSAGEGLPMALLEAMYLGKTCIVSDVIGNNDLIINGETGWLAHNVEEFVTYIKRLSEQKEINSRAHELVKGEYTIDNMCREYEKIYDL